jgi:hypothetical protein
LEIIKKPPTMCDAPPQVTQVWRMFFDEASSKESVGVGLVFISPYQEGISLSYKLEFETKIMLQSMRLYFWG